MKSETNEIWKSEEWQKFRKSWKPITKMHANKKVSILKKWEEVIMCADLLISID